MSAARKPIPPPKTASELLDLYYLDLRCYLLETAATLDRIERSSGGADAMEDERVTKLIEALDILKNPGPDRAERFLELLSV